MDVALILDGARAILGGGLALIGLLLIAGGALGVLRFPDFYTRLHASSVADGLGAVVLVLGLAVLAPNGALALRLILLAALIAMLSPLFAHFSANAAHSGGLAPLSGRYTAPRPGAPRGGQQS